MEKKESLKKNIFISILISNSILIIYIVFSMILSIAKPLTLGRFTELRGVFSVIAQQGGAFREIAQQGIDEKDEQQYSCVNKIEKDVIEYINETQDYEFYNRYPDFKKNMLILVNAEGVIVTIILSNWILFTTIGIVLAIIHYISSRKNYYEVYTDKKKILKEVVINYVLLGVITEILFIPFGIVSLEYSSPIFVWNIWKIYTILFVISLLINYCKQKKRVRTLNQSLNKFNETKRD